MNVNVKLFAAARDRAGSPNIDLTLPPGARVSDLRAALGMVCPEMAAILPQLWVAVNEEYAPDDTLLTEEARIACFPPVSGG
jgi:molybdopterin converting factor subunit 1